MLESGFYKVEYNDNAAFKSKLEDGYAMEVLLRRYDDPKKLQIKPFASSEGGGVSICFWADDSNQIVMETGTKNATGGNVWKTAKSGVTPLKDVYYHIVAVWDKAAGTQKIYVDGESIILKKYEPTCIFCGDAKNVINYRGKNICPNCLKEMKKL